MNSQPEAVVSLKQTARHMTRLACPSVSASRFAVSLQFGFRLSAGALEHAPLKSSALWDSGLRDWVSWFVPLGQARDAVCIPGLTVALSL